MSTKEDANSAQNLAESVEETRKNAQYIVTDMSKRSIGYWIKHPDTFSPPSPLATTFHDMNEALNGGFFYGSMYVLGGGTGKGKSTMVQNLARRWANNFVNVFLLTLEDSASLAVRKMIAAQAESPVKVVDGRYSPSESQHIAIEAAKQILPNSFMRIDEAVRDMDKVGDLFRAETLLGTRVFIIDQSSHLKVADAKTEYERHYKLSEYFSNLARELQIIIIVVSQINRSGTRDQRDGKTAGLDQLRASGTWENDAVGVIIIQKIDDATTPSVMELAVAKHRHGIGDNPKFQLSFKKSEQRIYELDKEAIVKKVEENDHRWTITKLVQSNFFTSIPESKQDLEFKAMEWSPKITSRLLEMIFGVIPTDGPEQKQGKDGLFGLMIGTKKYFCTSLDTLILKHNPLGVSK